MNIGSKIEVTYKRVMNSRTVKFEVVESEGEIRLYDPKNDWYSVFDQDNSYLRRVRGEHGGRILDYEFM